MRQFSKQVELFNSDSSLAPIVFMIGRTLNGHVNTDKREILGESSMLNSWIGAANRAVDFFSFQISAARKAIDTWTMVALRFGVVKDVRIVIARMIWQARESADYAVPNRSKTKCVLQ